MDTWLLLTYPAPWGAKALPESQLPVPIKACLEKLLATIPHSRVLLIKKGSSEEDQTATLFIAQGTARVPTLFEFPLRTYEDIHSIDVLDALANRTDYKEFLNPQSLFLVYTNGKRDPCCAQYGLPVYHALSEYAPDRTWQGSHVGAHRFAANVLVLPEGIYYGRVYPQDAARLLQADQAQTLIPEKLRGRATLDSPAQAAEYYLARQVDPGSWGLEKGQQIAPDRWSFIFLSLKAGRRYLIQVRVTLSDDRATISCRSDKLAPVTRYHLEVLEKLSK